MADQPLVPQDIQDQIDGKTPPVPPPETGNKRIIDEEAKNGDQVRSAQL